MAQLPLSRSHPLNANIRTYTGTMGKINQAISDYYQQYLMFLANMYPEPIQTCNQIMICKYSKQRYIANMAM